MHKNKIVIIVLFVFIVIKSFSQTIIKEVLGKEINTKYEELYPFITPDGKGLYFLRISHPDNTYGKEDSEDLWYSEVDVNGNFKTAVHLPKPFNTMQNNSMSGITPDRQTILINQAFKNGKIYPFPGFSIIKKNANAWSQPEMLNIKDYDLYDAGIVKGAYLCNDGKTILMYFSTRLQSAITDLFVSFKVSDTLWTRPMNLGKNINTQMYTECTPFLAADGKTLYFSSNRPGGCGDYDIYKSIRLDDSWQNWSKPINLGCEINTPSWDTYYSIDAKSEWAYMISLNEKNQKGDIVRYKIPKENKPEPILMLTGQVIDKLTNEILYTTVKYSNLNDVVFKGEANTDASNGFFKFTLPKDQNYVISADLSGYYSVSDTINTFNLNEYNEIKKDIFMLPVSKGQTIVLNNIFFDFNKAELKKESNFELKKLLDLLKKNPIMEIEVSGHTDDVGSKAFNKELSQKRADAVKKYLVENGIEATRIQSLGYGDEKPLIDNINTKEKSKNRRVEFTILK